MRKIPLIHSSKSSKGLAVLLSLLTLLLLAAGVLINVNWRGKIHAQKQSLSIKAMAEAKAAIIAWSTLSATHESAPGMLPCPLDFNELNNPSKIGESRPSCVNSAVLVGQLPWRTLKLPELRDGNGDLLWYVLSPGFRYPPINSNSRGKLKLDSQDDIVALVISPGVAQIGQNRNSPNIIPQVSNYLDGINASGGMNYTNHTNTSNDLILPITAGELFNKVHQRVANEVALELWKYYCGANNVKTQGGCSTTNLSTGNGVFPYAAAFNDSSCLGSGDVTFANGRCQPVDNLLAGRIPAANNWRPSSLLREITVDSGAAWFQENAWRELVYYAVSAACTGEGNCATGNLQVNYPDKIPAQVKLQEKFVIMIAGASLSSQMRASEIDKSKVSNYFENANATGSSQNFIMRQASSNENDQVYSYR